MRASSKSTPASHIAVGADGIRRARLCKAWTWGMLHHPYLWRGYEIFKMNHPSYKGAWGARLIGSILVVDEFTAPTLRELRAKLVTMVEGGQ